MTTQALTGLKVADFGWITVEPYLTKFLAEHGAEVVRLETRTKLDISRVSAPYRDNVIEPNRAAYFAAGNNNKYGITLNLKHPRALDVARRIVAWADVVAEGFTPGTMEKWGLGYEAVKEIKPDIVMFGTCNLGKTGPYGSHPGFGTQLVGYTGLASITGWPDGEPVIPDTPYTDALAPPFGAAAVLAALDHRRRTGQGQYIDLSQYEVAVYSLAPLLLDYAVNRRVTERAGNRHAAAAPHGLYACRGEDRWCAVAVMSDEMWARLGRAIGGPVWTRAEKFATLARRKEHEDELDELLTGWTRELTPHEVMTRLQAAGVPAGAVQTAEDLYADPQLTHRGHFQPMQHPEIGSHHYETPPFRLSATPAELSRPAPCMGEHNEYFYTRVLGMTDAEFIELLGDGVFE